MGAGPSTCSVGGSPRSLRNHSPSLAALIARCLFMLWPGLPIGCFPGDPVPRHVCADAAVEDEDQGIEQDSLVTPSDRDGDGTVDERDGCPDVFDPSQADQDDDGIGNACDADLDGDDVPNATDNCPDAANADQLDSDGDARGDLCDPC